MHGTEFDPVLFFFAAVQVAPQGGQADYSAQWIEYYRSMGMTREAEAIEQQARVWAFCCFPTIKTLQSQIFLFM
jgi:hypothetical protein